MLSQNRGVGTLPSPVGQTSWFSGGILSTTWVCPAGVTSICALAVGVGGSAYWSYDSGLGEDDTWGGSGGGLAWKNNITVVPGNTYNIVISTNFSYISPSDAASATCKAGAGGAFSAAGGTMLVGDGGGTGGVGQTIINGDAAGGGAGGYAGNGGSASNAGTGGGGGGGFTSTPYGGGGVGLAGQGADGPGGSAGSPTGKGGSGGVNAPGTSLGADFGGGAGVSVGAGSKAGGQGAVRLIWGAGRAFPSTLTGDL